MKIFFILTIIALFPQASWAQKLIFIVNSANPSVQISDDQLQDFFFKRTRYWPDGSNIRFFDRQDSSNLRKQFLSRYIGLTSRQVDQFWIAQKFNTGDSAPTQVISDSMMINLVSRFPGGIGYVGEGTDLNDKVKVLKITE